MAMFFDGEYDDDEADARAEERSLSHEIARRSCCDGFCGAMDCVRCRGSEALKEIFADEPDE